jgi:hypothetical protein
VEAALDRLASRHPEHHRQRDRDVLVRQAHDGESSSRCA